MPSLGRADDDIEPDEQDEDQPPSDPGLTVSTAYSSFRTCSLSTRLMVVGLLLMLGWMITRVLTVDYTEQTKTALMESGASQTTIDVFIPPTQADLNRAKLQKEALATQLQTNLTLVQGEIKSLRNDVDLLKKTLFPGPAGAKPPSGGGHLRNK